MVACPQEVGPSHCPAWLEPVAWFSVSTHGLNRVLKEVLREHSREWEVVSAFKELSH